MRCHNGQELTSRHFRAWWHCPGIKLVHIQQGGRCRSQCRKLHRKAPRRTPNKVGAKASELPAPNGTPQTRLTKGATFRREGKNVALNVLALTSFAGE